MFSIAEKEFKDLIKSCKSIFIIIFITICTVGFARLLNLFKDQLKSIGLGDNPYSAGLSLIVVIMCPLFIFALSHNAINEEIKNRTMRFLVTKTSRTNILLGKFMGILLFWFICILIPLLTLIYFSHTFDFKALLESLFYILYFITLAILFSTLFKNPMFTNFLGIGISLLITILGFMSIGTEKIYLKLFSYITPFYYISHENPNYIYFSLIFPIIFLILSIYIIRKKDL